MSVSDEVDAFFHLPLPQQRAHLHQLIEFRNAMCEISRKAPRLGQSTAVAPVSPHTPAQPTAGKRSNREASFSGTPRVRTPSMDQGTDPMFAAAQACAMQTEGVKGCLFVKVLGFRELKRKSTSSECSLYCLMNIGKKYKKTNVFKSKGVGELVTMTVEDTVAFPKVKAGKKEVVITVTEQLGFGRDRSIGSVVIPMSQLSVSVVDERWCPVRTKAGASTGEIRIRTLFREGKEDDLAEDESMHINPHRVFGTPLDELIEREKNDALDVDVPLVVSQCVRRLKSHCLDEEGLFRVSSVQEKMLQMQELYDLGKAKTVVFDDGTSPHTISGLLKLYLDSLPEPLLTFDLREEFLKVHELETDSEKINRLKELVKELPEANRAVLSCVMQLLILVAHNSDINRMGEDNLGIIFGMLLIRSPAGMQSADALSFASAAASVASTMIRSSNSLFSKRNTFRTSQSFTGRSPQLPPPPAAAPVSPGTAAQLTTAAQASPIPTPLSPTGTPGESGGALSPGSRGGGRGQRTPAGTPLGGRGRGRGMHRRAKSESGSKGGAIRKGLPPQPAANAAVRAGKPVSPRSIDGGEGFDPAKQLKQLRPVSRQ